ncbi:MAG TPA: TrmH family RNA methyltransferase, partial [Thermoanaerobaculia bacterium]|nr:TrmH family RNA methyltransferase [Thermoanaerobaculia bacterium]
MDSQRLGVVLVRPRLSANLGAVARASKNFGVRDLRVVEPGAPADEEARRLASGADDRLEGLRRFQTVTQAVADFEVVVATSSLRGRSRHRSLDLADLPGFLEGVGPGARVALVFGSEKSGLTEEEMSHASVFLRLPTDPDFPTLNVAHAVAVALAATRMAFGSGRGVEEGWAPAREVEGAMTHWDRALDAIGFYDTGHRDRTLRDWRRLIAGRPLSVREVAILRGVANRILVALRRSSRLPAFSSQPKKDSD